MYLPTKPSQDSIASGDRHLTAQTNGPTCSPSPPSLSPLGTLHTPCTYSPQGDPRIGGSTSPLVLPRPVWSIAWIICFIVPRRLCLARCNTMCWKPAVFLLYDHMSPNQRISRDGSTKGCPSTPLSWRLEATKHVSMLLSFNHLTGN